MVHAILGLARAAAPRATYTTGGAKKKKKKKKKLPPRKARLETG